MRMNLKLVKNAEEFARLKHAEQFRDDGITPYVKHLESVVNELKSMGVIDEDILCTGWLASSSSFVCVFFG